MADFERTNPEIAKYWQDSSQLDTLEIPKNLDNNAPVFESWDIAAKRLMNKLWKVQNAWIFHEPVDSEKLEIPDYNEVVTTPMDFGTVRNKLHNNQYKDGMQEFLEDINLTFENCIKYNGEDSSVGKMCKAVRDEFVKIYHQLNLDFYQ